MPKSIWKYVIPIQDRFVIEMPPNAEFLTFQAQGNTPTAWFRVDSESPERPPRTFRLAGTGHSIGDEKYLGTCQMNGGALVRHLFED